MKKPKGHQKRPPVNKVVFIDHDDGLSGSTVSLKYIINYFKKAGTEVYVITPKHEHLQKIYCDLGAQCFQLTGRKNTRKPLFLHLHFTADPSAFSLRWVVLQMIDFFEGIFRVFRLLRTIKPDLLYINEYVSIHLALSAKLLRIPVALHVRSRFTKGSFGIRPLLINFIARHACDRIIAITEIEAKQFVPLIGNRISVVNEFLDDSNFSALPDVLTLRKTFTIPDGFAIVTMLGGVCPIKGTYEFIQAAQIVLQKKKNVLFAIAGPEIGPTTYIQNCKSQPASSQMQEHFLFLNLIKNPINLLAITDILVSPTIETHFSRPIIEAWAQKKAVIATDTPHSKSLVSHNVNGLLVKTGDAVEMALAIERLLQNPGFRQQLGESGYRKAASEFDCRENIGKIFSLCHQTQR
jgi:glycosyltransferase involved in cell wall biosynthesis